MPVARPPIFPFILLLLLFFLLFVRLLFEVRPEMCDCKGHCYTNGCETLYALYIFCETSATPAAFHESKTLEYVCTHALKVIQIFDIFLCVRINRQSRLLFTFCFWLPHTFVACSTVPLHSESSLSFRLLFMLF